MADEIIKVKTAEAAENPQEMANEVMDAALAGVKAGTSDVVPPAEGGGPGGEGGPLPGHDRGVRPDGHGAVQPGGDQHPLRAAPPPQL